MLQNKKPEDFVIATGEQHSVREFVELAFSFVSIKIKWIGKGVQEKGIDEKTGNTLIEIDPKYYRPTEVDSLLGDPTKAEKKLGWNPKETSFKKLVKIMIKHDIKLVENDHLEGIPLLLAEVISLGKYRMNLKIKASLHYSYMQNV